MVQMGYLTALGVRRGRQPPLWGHLMGNASPQFLPSYSDDLRWNVFPFPQVGRDLKSRAGCDFILVLLERRT